MLKIRIKNLFGYFNYEFCTSDGRITILTGPNGFGKSTIIKFLNAIGNSELNFFVDVVFDEFELENMETQKKILIKKQKESIEINSEKISNRDILLLSRGRRSKNAEENEKSYTSYQKSIRSMREMFETVNLIKEQRLIRNIERRSPHQVSTIRDYQRGYERDWVEVVEEIPDKLAEKMRAIGSEYSRVSNMLDSTYPERLFRQEKGISEEEFYSELQLMKDKIEKLNRNGVGSIKALENVDFKQEDARALKIYFDDFNKKYETYRILVERLELFTEIVNKRFKFKRIEISNEEGMVIRGDNCKLIRLSCLSSGEKEIIVLFYTLLFEIMDNSLLLIDEPEISLHIAWQRLFSEDLKKIADLKNVDVLVATHSPQIVNGNRNIQVDLGELYKNGLNQRSTDKG